MKIALAIFPLILFLSGCFVSDYPKVESFYTTFSDYDNFPNSTTKTAVPIGGRKTKILIVTSSKEKPIDRELEIKNKLEEFFKVNTRTLLMIHTMYNIDRHRLVSVEILYVEK